MSIDSLTGLAAAQGIPSLRPTISGREYVVTAGHYLAAQAAHSILEAGGNAVDAGVCAVLVMGVVQSEMVNIAGVAPIAVYLADRDEVLTISGLGYWPRSVTPDFFVREHGGSIPEGILRTVVPAAPDACITALADFGTMTFGEVARSAIGFARDGYVMYPFQANLLETFADTLAQWPSSAEIYLPNGAPPKVGDLFVQTDLAATLQYMVDCETAASGKGREAGLDAARDAFYRGDIARTIVNYHEANGGLLTMEDMAGFRVETERALARKVGSSTVYSCGAWCQGPSLLQILATLEGVDLVALGHNSTAYVHTITEAIKLCFADRHHYFGDPHFEDVPVDKLLSAAYCAERLALISPTAASPKMPSPGSVGQDHRANLEDTLRRPPTLPALDTSYVAIIDGQGNVFSCTPSDVSTDTPVVPGTGLCPSSRGSQSWADPSHPSSVAPGKRPRLTPAPFLFRTDSGGIGAFGTPGGDVQLQALVQVWLNIELFGMSPQQAVEAPRFATYSFPDSFEPHAYNPGRLNLEARFEDDQMEALAKLGHDVVPWPDFAWRAGAVCFARKLPSGVLEAAADPRRPAYAIGR